MNVMRGLLLLLFLAALASGGSLNDVDHVVIFMQENRAFDHYYGLLRGVRGFNDRTVHLIPSGRPAWYQPTNQTDSSLYMLPWHVDTLRTSATCMPAPEMNFPCDIRIWNNGHYDSWNTARDPGFGMSYFNRSDLPYYFALADAFTIGDQYFQSTFTETNPNRLFLFSGGNGPSSGFPAVLNNGEPVPGWTWPTAAEILEAKNISWRVYQQEDNFDDNGFAWFSKFQFASPGSPYYDKGIRTVDDIVEAFDQDMKTGKLPSVSWLIAPRPLSEHATNHPAAGEDLSARLIAKLQANPAVYAKTVFILNYDEGGQFVDHHWTPTPTRFAGEGKSAADVTGDITTLNNTVLPTGMGYRVPLIIVSPWTRGGFVNSQVFDHTSVLQLIEQRWNVRFPPISPWRRAVAGDLTSFFDWNNPDYSWPVFPDTSDYVNQSDYECNSLPLPKLPTIQSMPTQEPGIKSARQLPYQFQVEVDIFSSQDANVIDLTLSNADVAGAYFHMVDLTALSTPPRKYTVLGGGVLLTDSISVAPTQQDYHSIIHGANGFVRQFSGSFGFTQCKVTTSYDVQDGAIVFQLSNTAESGSNAVCVFTLVDNSYGTGGPWVVKVNPQQTQSQSVSVASSGNWYDVSIVANDLELFFRRFMGRIERPGCTSDPAAANGPLNPLHPFPAPASHPTFAEIMASSRQLNHAPANLNRQTQHQTEDGFVANKDAERCFGSPIDTCDPDTFLDPFSQLVL